MSILFHNKGQIVQLSNDTISYVMEIVDGKYLVHRYFGRKIRNYRGTGNPLYFKRGYNTEHDSSVEKVLRFAFNGWTYKVESFLPF